MRFYLGTDRMHWLWDRRFHSIPLFISRRVLARRKRLKRLALERAPVAIDSAGFTELSMNGEWLTSPQEYVSDVTRFVRELGAIAFAAPQDWMCEEYVCASVLLAERKVKPDGAMLARSIAKVPPGKRTRARLRHLKVLACLPLPELFWQRQILVHQRKTVANYLYLRRLAPSLPFIPVLQGYTKADYLRHIDDYTRAGVRLSKLPLVGVGSICRRQGTAEATEIISAISRQGVKVHAFGFKTEGLASTHRIIASADSMAWSYAGRKRKLPGCWHGKNGNGHCGHCAIFALKWYRSLESKGYFRMPKEDSPF